MSAPVTKPLAVALARKTAAADQFLRRAETAHRRMGPNGLCAFGWRAILVKENLSILFGGKKARSNGVDTHALAGPFAGEKLAEAENSRFGCRIGYDARKRKVRGDTGDIDDRALSARDHSGSEDLAGDQDPANDIEVEVRFPILDRNVLKGAAGADRDSRSLPPAAFKRIVAGPKLASTVR